MVVFKSNGCSDSMSIEHVVEVRLVIFRLDKDNLTEVYLDKWKHD